MQKNHILCGNHGDVYSFKQKIYGVTYNKIFKSVKIKNVNIFNEILYTLQSYLPIIFQSKRSQYIRSYLIEYLFYRNQKNFIGVYLPYIFSYKKDTFFCRCEYVFEDVSSEFKLTKNNILQIIYSISKFHKTFFNKKINHTVWSNGGYWTSNKRFISDHFFVNQFRLFEKNMINFNIYLQTNSILSFILSKKQSISEYYSNNITLIHGDFKTDNFFLKKNSLVLFDWQWVGYGNPATDIMYFIITSFPYKKLNDYHIQFFIHEYCNKIKLISFDTFYKDFQTAFIDYFKYLVCSKWFDITKDDLMKNKKNKKDGLHIQSRKRIQRICDLIELYSYYEL